jgi:hypothetical protein
MSNSDANVSPLKPLQWKINLRIFVAFAQTQAK